MALTISFQLFPSCNIKEIPYLCVSTSTISRELRKNCDMRNGTYNYDLA